VPCHICGQKIRPDEEGTRAYAPDDAPDHINLVCLECIESGLGAIKARLVQRAEEGERRAKALAQDPYFAVEVADLNAWAAVHRADAAAEWVFTDRPEDPYCPRCGVHVADKDDADGEVVCRFCRGHAHDLVEGTTICSTCAVPQVEAELRRRARDAEEGVNPWRDWHDCTMKPLDVDDARKDGSGLLAESCRECGWSRVSVFEAGRQVRGYFEIEADDPNGAW
jgi:hypothetical protein